MHAHGTPERLSWVSDAGELRHQLQGVLQGALLAGRNGEVMGEGLSPGQLAQALQAQLQTALKPAARLAAVLEDLTRSFCFRQPLHTITAILQTSHPCIGWRILHQARAWVLCLRCDGIKHGIRHLDRQHNQRLDCPTRCVYILLVTCHCMWIVTAHNQLGLQYPLECEGLRADTAIGGSRVLASKSEWLMLIP